MKPITLPESTLNQLAQRVSERMLEGHYFENDLIRGDELKEFADHSQVNKFLIFQVYQAWEMQINKLNHPYFNLAHPDIQQQLDLLKNQLSQHIEIKLADFKPMLSRAVYNNLRLVLDPEGSFADFFFAQDPKLPLDKYERHAQFFADLDFVVNSILRYYQKNQIQVVEKDVFFVKMEKVIEVFNRKSGQDFETYRGRIFTELTGENLQSFRQAVQAEQEAEARRQAEEAARRQAEEAARRQAEEAARRQAETARRQAEEAARRQAEEEARREAEEAARQAAEAARRQAEEEARRQAEEARKQNFFESVIRDSAAAPVFDLDEDLDDDAPAPVAEPPQPLVESPKPIAEKHVFPPQPEPVAETPPPAAEPQPEPVAETPPPVAEPQPEPVAETPPPVAEPQPEPVAETPPPVAEPQPVDPPAPVSKPEPVAEKPAAEKPGVDQPAAEPEKKAPVAETPPEPKKEPSIAERPVANRPQTIAEKLASQQSASRPALHESLNGNRKIKLDEIPIHKQYQYVQKVFEGNNVRFRIIVDKVNNAQNKAEVEDILTKFVLSNDELDKGDPVVTEFLALLRNRF